MLRERKFNSLAEVLVVYLARSETNEYIIMENI